MARQGKIVGLQLEELVLDARERGRSLEQIRDECNAELAKRHAAALLKPGPEGVTVLDAAQLGEKPPTVSKPAVERYLRALDEHSVAPAHQPQLAERAARQAIDFGDRLIGLDEKLQRWLTEADTATKPVMVGSGENAYTEQVTDWQARTTVAREVSRVLTIYADVMERVHNAQHVQEFQRIVYEAIQEADGPTAARIVERLQQVRAARQAGMLGL